MIVRGMGAKLYRARSAGFRNIPLTVIALTIR